MYYVIPIFKDPNLHSLHKSNGLTAIYVVPLNEKNLDNDFFIIQYHPDSDKFMEDYKWLKKKMIVTPDAKTLLHIYPFEFVIDLNAVWWLKNNKPFNMDSIRNNAIDFLSNKY